MISSVNSSVSAINAALKLQSVSAHNVANVSTDGFKSQETSVQENENSGVKVTISQSNHSGTIYDKGGYGNVVESSNVDLAKEAVNQMSARHMFAANVTALKTYQEMQETIIDMMA